VFSGSEVGSFMWSMPAAREHVGEGEARNSLSLAVLGAWEEPDALRFSTRIDSGASFVRLDYWKQVGEERKSVGRPTTIERKRQSLTAAAELREQNIKEGLHPGDLVALFPVQPPSDAACQSATIPYERVLTGDEVALRREFSGKVVLIADLRNRADTITRP